MSKKGSDIIVENLINHEVPYIFKIPGAKIDGVFDALVDKEPKLNLAGHEKNADFMAQGIGRLTGEP
ncbi:thiamine pyrophosphate-binding protein, partial [Enterococcus faecalis]|uniref:thiamine pyrophosphate-binding protein n=1 Tax=Enterococcus faecalis TaxID=1351 RepID=UPI003D6AA097